ncbi:MAG: alpha/beta hydrolase [Candidatus Devosia euplotis]|nr:alpha/beta hydrolase [Candidatus Devosia euplotis]
MLETGPTLPLHGGQQELPRYAPPRTVPGDHSAFAGLPVSYVSLVASLQAAVHVAGTLSRRKLAVLCLPGYQRNMSDFTTFAAYFRRVGGGDWPVVLLDLPGRGRSDNRAHQADYSSLTDARDVASVMTALSIDRAIALDHGGHVAMALAAAHPPMVVGAVLLDAGPVIDSCGIVRLRNNLEHIDALRGAKAVQSGFRRILGGDYPGIPDDQLEP